MFRQHHYKVFVMTSDFSRVFIIIVKANTQSKTVMLIFFLNFFKSKKENQKLRQTTTETLLPANIAPKIQMILQINNKVLLNLIFL